MAQPSGFVDSARPSHVCRLWKAIYGLKQAPRAWFLALKTFLLDYGFKNAYADTSLFILSKEGSTLYLLVYVDNIIVMGNNFSLIDSFVTSLSSKFSLKDLGELNYFLSIKVLPTASGIFLSQKKKISS